MDLVTGLPKCHAYGNIYDAILIVIDRLSKESIFPHLTAVEDDLETLEIRESGDFEQVSRAHRYLERPFRTHAGSIISPTDLPYRFPPTVPLTGLGALSDVLVCRHRWDNPMALDERDLVLGVGSEMQNYLKNWREHAAKAVVEAFQVVKKEEMRAYGDYSYFAHHRGKYARGAERPNPPPDYNEKLWKGILQVMWQIRWRL
ncbi:hypothetical protein MMC22_004129 [Lobaria immixta]|nr:hypothetical protein [Lobaria immixta]